MAEVPTWEVDLFVDGPLTLRRRFSTMQQKGFRSEDPFYSNIEITGTPSGLRATVTARASNEQLAFEAAVFFFGRMLDVLAFEIDRPLFLSFTERERPRNGRVRQDVRRIIEPQEIENAFQAVDDLSTTDAPFLRSLSWYRKGLHTEDPFDKFLAFWIAIERVAAEYFQIVPEVDLERAKNGSKSQVWECFKAVWGPCKQWPNIPGNDKWIDENYEIRTDIAHGIRSVDIQKVASVVDKLDTIRQVTHRFLRDWREEYLRVDKQALDERLPDSDEGLATR